ncbi:hypothetical protein HHL16_01590 [Pseudoflavitalea sp. G-6-1-2]|uniref:hypothetical protein n=1 Tax=Pseudoflavitalea sp. G-6-1-2 TaxID=2728841 RepID=UPI00146BE5B2|nr:hypothetical protein [Pseudoflavitalea sp. G-6-1-2]NML19541.1 hypothetical protein [Pseudoflavitalea sp. G-6-1-2]
MKKISSLTTILGLSLMASAQVSNQQQFDAKRAKQGQFEMACFILNGGKFTEFGTFNMEVNTDNNRFSIFTVFTTNYSDEVVTDTSISDGQSFLPIYRSSYSKKRELKLKFGNEVTGYHLDKQTGKRTAIKESVKDAYIDNYAYPYLLGTLPLTTGFKKQLAVYEYKPENKSSLKRVMVEETKNNIFDTKNTGQHKVWAVSIFEELTGDRYIYHVDKETGRIWKVEITDSKGNKMLMIDKETDYNPFTTAFTKQDKENALNMIKNGNSVIIGEAFARDNQNAGTPLGNIAVFNINKKQHAAAGTQVVLIPYTDFYKEWVKLNKAARKKGKGIPLPNDAADCIKVATVYDDKGHFEFTNLMPGEYLVFTEFGYTHTFSRSEVVGYTDHYVNGLFQGSTTNSVSRGYASNATAAPQKVVTIKKDGDKEEIKLKKTL